ncbi:transporter, NhaC family (TC 2.A.35) [Peptoclostridium litorale DSM 5388]|uniref:Na(+)/H(+) antiporter NhaC n=1 Tax=Peptoclostridium litorale DSM 5388 TaxID=1121324 RepID=A0A069REB5_PEPLI|nr:Na+/H+ antiporter NhaC family protein [Peptoclostridium litorale]KDR94530.1 Na(+)/H(+) antiporter NhaC [Peptoclostridium litorale DSM 5388]SIO35109.1 transporter, NhaC family (TC 2.A.35) [Peptoclostridium litorale DSM 5388]
MKKVIVSLCIISLSIFLKLPVYYGIGGALIFLYAAGIFSGFSASALNKSIIGGPLSAKNVLLVLSSIGVLTSMWMLCGTIPYLMFMGLKILKNYNFIFFSFLIMSFISLSLGTGIGSISTMGVVLLGVGKSMGISLPVLSGAIVSGAYLGDRSSPLSSAFNLVTEITSTNAQDNIRRMNSSLLPAFLISAAIYYFLGSSYPSLDYSGIDGTLVSIQNSFHIGLFCTLPLIILFSCIMLRLPTFKSISASILSAALISVLFQNASAAEILSAAVFGFKNDSLDIPISGGGFLSMKGVLITIILATSFAGILSGLDLISSMIKNLSKSINSKYSLIVHSGLISFILNTITCNQTIGIIIPGKFMNSHYEKFDLKKEYLVQSISDVGTMTVAMVPWNVNAIVVCAVLGVDYSDFAPYAFLCYVLPIVFFTMYKIKAPD